VRADTLCSMLRPGHVIVICAMALLTLGVVMVNSAGMTVNARTPVTIESILLSRSSIYMGLAMVALAMTALLPVFRFTPGVPGRWMPFGAKPAQTFDVEPNQAVSLPALRRFGGWSLWPMWACVAILLAVMASVYVPGLSREINGSHRWLGLKLPGIGDLSVQPSEIAKWVLIGVIAWYAWKMGSGLRKFFTGLMPGLAAIGIVAAFVVIEDLGTGVLIALVGSTVLLVGGARWWQFMLFVPPAAGAFAYAVHANPYRLTRITSFLDPYADPLGAGYHQVQSMIAVANGQVWGRGLGFSLSKFGYLPEDTTDFLFGIICEELGLAGAALVITLYIAMIWAGFMIIMAQRSKVMALIGVGIITTICVQAVINLAVVTGMAPTKGIALPLLSSGGTGWILTCACLGLLVNMDRFARRQRRRESAAFTTPAAPGNAASFESSSRPADQLPDISGARHAVA
jgi:cell division protein FtsW